MISLYPAYKAYPIQSCTYTVYGPSRIYLYELKGLAGTVKVISSVQNNEEETGKETHETVQKEEIAELEATEANHEKISKEVSRFNVIKLSRAYEIPRVVLALKAVTRQFWKTIRSAPLVRCLERWERGTYNFRFHFQGISQ